MKKLFVLLFAMTAFAVSSVAQETATYEDATTQVPDDLPLDEIFKLIDQVSEPGPLLKAAGYKYVGEYADGRSVIETWCRNCTCNKRGEVLSFQSGTSSVVCSFMGMGSPSTLLLEVFNTKARDAIIYKLEQMGFAKDANQPPTYTSFTRSTNDSETYCNMEKSKKGWLFSISPVVMGSE